MCVVVSVKWRARNSTHQPAPTGISQSKAKRVQEYVVAGRCLLMWLVRARLPITLTLPSTHPEQHQHTEIRAANAISK